MDSNGMKVTYKEQLDLLPEGSFIEHEDKPFLILKSNLLIGWTAFGYQDSIELTKGIEVTVLTPKSIVNTFRAGYLIKHT